MRAQPDNKTGLPRNILFLIAGIMLGSWVSMSSSAHAQAEGCPGPQGTSTVYAFEGLPTARADITPSVHRSLSILGLVAKRSDCTITITCVAKSAGENSLRARDRQCTAARGAVVRYETRANVRSRLADEIELIKLDGPQGGYQAASVYVTLIAN